MCQEVGAVVGNENIKQDFFCDVTTSEGEFSHFVTNILAKRCESGNDGEILNTHCGTAHRKVAKGFTLCFDKVFQVVSE